MSTQVDGWLRDALSDGPRPVVEVLAAGEVAGFSEHQLNRARRRVGAVSWREGFGPGAVQLWAMERPPIEVVDVAADHGADHVRQGADHEAPMVGMVRAEDVVVDSELAGVLTGVQRAYLTALASLGVVTTACEAAGISRGTLQTWRNLPGFRDAEQLAREVAADRLEAEAWRRATVGGTKQVVASGRILTVRDRPSDRLLEMLLRAKRPAEFDPGGEAARRIVEQAGDEPVLAALIFGGDEAMRGLLADVEDLMGVEAGGGGEGGEDRAVIEARVVDGFDRLGERLVDQ